MDGGNRLVCGASARRRDERPDTESATKVNEFSQLDMMPEESSGFLSETQVEPPHEGWNWSVAKSGWDFLYVPGKGDPQPKR